MRLRGFRGFRATEPLGREMAPLAETRENSIGSHSGREVAVLGATVASIWLFWEPLGLEMALLGATLASKWLYWEPLWPQT